MQGGNVNRPTANMGGLTFEIAPFCSQAEAPVTTQAVVQHTHDPEFRSLEMQHQVQMHELQARVHQLEHLLHKERQGRKSAEKRLSQSNLANARERRQLKRKIASLERRAAELNSRDIQHRHKVVRSEQEAEKLRVQLRRRLRSVQMRGATLVLPKAPSPFTDLEYEVDDDVVGLLNDVDDVEESTVHALRARFRHLRRALSDANERFVKADKERGDMLSLATAVAAIVRQGRASVLREAREPLDSEEGDHISDHTGDHTGDHSSDHVSREEARAMSSHVAKMTARLLLPLRDSSSVADDVRRDVRFLLSFALRGAGVTRALARGDLSVSLADSSFSLSNEPTARTVATQTRSVDCVAVETQTENNVETVESSVQTDENNVETVEVCVQTDGNNVATVEMSVQTDENNVETVESSVQTVESSFQTDESPSTTIEGAVQTVETSAQTDETSVQTVETSVQMDESSVQTDERPCVQCGTLRAVLTRLSAACVSFQSQVTQLQHDSRRVVAASLARQLVSEARWQATRHVLASSSATPPVSPSMSLSVSPSVSSSVSPSVSPSVTSTASLMSESTAPRQQLRGRDEDEYDEICDMSMSELKELLGEDGGDDDFELLEAGAARTDSAHITNVYLSDDSDTGFGGTSSDNRNIVSDGFDSENDLYC
ncbi:MAG: hypothetical protein MHM6MM_004596 [Cercozoa sp. M6MM]